MPPINAMKSTLFATALAFSVLLASSGCKKKDVAADQPEGEVNAAVAKGMSETDKLIQQKKFDEAAAALLTMQMSGAVQSDADGWKYNNKMTILQNELSAAASAGDKKAQQAIEMLRQSRTVR
jgi:hypothetical protein